MPKFRLVALSNPKDGTTEEFTRWYEDQHLTDVAAVPGVTGASFHHFAAGNERWQYLAIYEVEADDPTTVLAEINRRSGTALMPISSALDGSDVFFSAFAERGVR